MRMSCVWLQGAALSKTKTVGISSIKGGERQDNRIMIFWSWVCKKKSCKFFHNNMGLVTAQLVKHSSTNPPSVQQILNQH